MKFFRFASIFLILSLLSGCGIPQDKYDTISSEKNTLNTQIISMQSDLVKAQEQIKNLRDEISELTMSYPDLESELSATAEEIEQLKLELPNLKRLFVYKMLFCTTKPSFGNYTVKPDNTYKVGETVWIYNEYGGFRTLIVNGKIMTNYQSSFNILDEKGEVINKSASTTLKELDRPVSSWWGSKEYNNLKAGNYIYEVTIEDKISREILTERREFKVIP